MCDWDSRTRHHGRRSIRYLTFGDAGKPTASTSCTFDLDCLSSTLTTMDNSPFARLSPELRNHIYEIALRHDQPLYVPPSTHLIRKAEYEVSSLGLLRTCKAVSEESTRLFYNVNTFAFECRGAGQVDKRLKSFADTIGPANTEVIQSIVLDAGTMQMDSFETVYATLNELNTFLERINILDSGNEWHCTFSAKICLMAQSPGRSLAIFKFDLNFGDVEKSWAANMEELDRKVSQKPAADWRSILFVMQQCRQHQDAHRL